MARPEQKSALNIVMGAMTFGEAGKEQARVHDLETVNAILDIFQAHGHYEVDTARVYGGGTSEEYLGKINWQNRGLVMDTKLAPRSPGGPISQMTGGNSISHFPDDLRKNLIASLKALNADKIDMWYLHAPDRWSGCTYEETLRAVNDLHKEGYFNRFGISNYASWEVAEMVQICRHNGWIQPIAYQGIYNAVHRGVEPELFPCLRKFGISFYEFNPLGGGFFTGTFVSKEDKPEAGSRFDPGRVQGQSYRKRYWNDAYFAALGEVKVVCENHGLTMAEVALRWCTHHSLMKKEYGDAILIGASSVKHIEQNLIDLEKGPLPAEVVQVLDDAWLSVKGVAANYWH